VFATAAMFAGNRALWTGSHQLNRRGFGDFSYSGIGDAVVPQIKRKLGDFIRNSAKSYIENSKDWHPAKRLDNKPPPMRVNSRFRRNAPRRKFTRKKTFSQPSTFQKDSVNVYSKRPRRGSRRMKFRARRFRNAVRKVIDSNLGLKSYSLKANGTFNALSDEQAFNAFLTGTTNGSNTLQSGDLYRVMNASIYGTVSTPMPNKQDRITLLNSTGQLTIVADTLNTTPCYITFWRIMCRTECDDADVSATDIFVNGLAQNDSTTTGGTALVPSSIPTTPFLSSEFCQHFLITNVRRISLDPGIETVVTWNNRKRKQLAYSDMIDTLAMPGVTSGYLIQIYGGLDSATGLRAATTIHWEFVRTYNSRHSLTSRQHVVDIS